MARKNTKNFEDRFSFNPEPGNNVGLVMVFGILIICMACLGAGYWLGGGLADSSPNNRMRLFSENLRLKALIERYKKDIVALESKIQVDRETNKSILKQMDIVQSENTQLKEDLAFFDSLLPADTAQRGIYFRSVSLKPVAGSDKHHLRVLIMQSGSKAFQNLNEFSGNLKFTVTYTLNGTTQTLLFPNATTANLGIFDLKFKYYKRIDVNFSLPPGAVPRKIEFTVMQGNTIVTSHTTTL